MTMEKETRLLCSASSIGVLAHSASDVDWLHGSCDHVSTYMVQAESARAHFARCTSLRSAPLDPASACVPLDLGPYIDMYRPEVWSSFPQVNGRGRAEARRTTTA